MPMNFVVRFPCIIICFILVASISGCGQGHETNSSNMDSGSAVFGISWPEDAPTQAAAKALGHPTIDCTGISAIKVEVYDDPDSRYLAGDSFDCSQGEGTVGDIPAGSDRRVVVLVLGDANTLLYRGEKGNITILKNERTDVGLISVNKVEPDNQLPTATIIQPQEGIFVLGDAITFEGSGEDAEDGQLSGSDLQWKSDIDGPIGEGAQFDKNGLSAGDHTITLTVTDSDGGAGTATTRILVNKLPTASIIQPLEGTFTYGNEITFAGRGEDIEDGELFGSHIIWLSDIDGQIGQGAQFDKNDLSVGIHTITLRVTDNDGGAYTATIRITISSEKVNSIGMIFKFIPAGTFIMGSPEEEPGRDWNEVQHEVNLTQPFLIQTTEVTQGQWEAVMGEGTNPSDFAECGDDCPVETVSWYDCVIFCNQLSQKESLTPSYYADSSYTIVFDGTPPVTSGNVYLNQDSNGYRLPTEEQWEYAARAGTTTAFANGDITYYEDMSVCIHDPNLYEMGWYCGNNAASPGAPGYGTKSVAQRSANAWGLFDMHGNVWEWCQDWDTDLPDVPYEIYVLRVLRGGAWNSIARYCRAAHHSSNVPDARESIIGFRLALVPGQ